ncbi:MAG: OmpH family outer membrane protein [Bacteroidota bacterium]|uniref:Outer membrane protein H n=1 Tax=Christiangramia flava JLT2011 TaxID=1229726 RepID=A0A1L7I0U1_9FLAO|nr:OmpH family outer membrane protein [Christiangramia flava]APU67217.1 Outer membrane protein H precursor [Christiangramia flava JLT2011]MAM17752.1 outer membrane chaperone Skp [Christiangramia sp.]MEE2771523.1 OmpH family outer membrane protein [Bacteroidota bacterium]OSS39802.1 Outer membrane protein H precursor [Christiangramia flava JLT2011]|tara:strand:- start:135 stop:689 length:555 start_codon:yes stop_codon:yes gene_type:complete
MKKASLAVVFLFVSLATFAQSKIGTIDAEYILSQMPETADLNKQLEEYNQQLQGDLQGNITDYEALVKDYQATNDTLSETALKEKQGKLMELENDIKGFRQKAGVMIQMKRNELTGPLYEKIDAAMKQVIQQEGYTQIFHASASGLAFSRVEDDITEKVMDILGIEAKAPQTNPNTVVKDDSGK